ncbi:MAG TPA: hypothetical protein VGK14_10930 [Novimethylophilus sp.]|jgi:hypothetical protein|uniref:hypothetical protein n=1 Tax=Novimethylophilus sp. TaxID=2137426 RepID=UPI002F41CDA0
MRQPLSRKFNILWLAIALLAGCAANPSDSRFAQNVKDIHESLSSVIARNGFSHEIRSQRDGPREVDSIFIPISLDSLKRRHYSLDNLMNEIGSVCVLPEYIRLPVLIEIGADDEEDRMYLKSALMPSISGRANIQVITAPDTDNNIAITVEHPR